MPKDDSQDDEHDTLLRLVMQHNDTLIIPPSYPFQPFCRMLPPISERNLTKGIAPNGTYLLDVILGAT